MKRKHKSQEGFQKGHLKYTTKGDFKKGRIPWNKGTSIWLEYKCLECGKKYKVRKCHTHNGISKFCSKRCQAKTIIAGKNEGIKIIKICKQCNKSFEIRPCEEYRKFCSKECVNKSRIGVKRIPFTEEHKRKIGEANKLIPHPFGKNHPCWKGGITPFVDLLRTLDEYKKWRIECLRKDWFRCQECFVKDNLEVHHIKSFTKIVNEFLQQYNQFSIIDDRETLIRLAITHKSFWDINNGQTLCEIHHKSLTRSIKNV